MIRVYKAYWLFALFGWISIAACKKSAVPAFTTDKSSYYLEEDVSFSNSSQGADSFLWNFGDGSISTDQSPIHRYTISGEYMVDLKVNGDQSYSRKVKVHPGLSSYSIVSNLNITIENLVSYHTTQTTLLDFTAHERSNFESGRKTDTIYTSRKDINYGFFYDKYSFLVPDVIQMDRHGHKEISLNQNTYVSAFPKIGSWPHSQGYLKQVLINLGL